MAALDGARDVSGGMHTVTVIDILGGEEVARTASEPVTLRSVVPPVACSTVYLVIMYVTTTGLHDLLTVTAFKTKFVPLSAHCFHFLCEVHSGATTRAVLGMVRVP